VYGRSIDVASCPYFPAIPVSVRWCWLIAPLLALQNVSTTISRRIRRGICSADRSTNPRYLTADIEARPTKPNRFMQRAGYLKIGRSNARNWSSTAMANCTVPTTLDLIARYDLLLMSNMPSSNMRENEAILNAQSLSTTRRSILGRSQDRLSIFLDDNHVQTLLRNIHTPMVIITYRC
jgi:hypothetical protein